MPQYEFFFFFFFNGKENASKMFIKNMAAFHSEAGGRRKSQESALGLEQRQVGIVYI